MKVAAPAIKAQRTQHCTPLARWSYFYWLIIVQHAWEIHGGVQGTLRSAALVLHNTQLLHGGREGQVRVIFTLSSSHFVYHSNEKPCSIIHEGSNVLMSPTHGSSRGPSWQPLRPSVSHMMRDKRRAEGGKKQVITSYLHLEKCVSPQRSYFCV